MAATANPPSYEMTQMNNANSAPMAALAPNGAPLHPTNPQGTGGMQTDPTPTGPHRSYRGDWQVSCLGVCCTNPGDCCYAQLCLPCLLYRQRQQLMQHHTPPLNDYTCCMERVGGQYVSKYCLCRGPYPMSGGCGQCCLAFETACCFFGTIPAHRREIGDQYGVDLGKEEWPAHLVACISFIPVFGWAGGFLIGYASCCCYACLAAQQQVELDTRGAPPPGPVKQVMS